MYDVESRPLRVQGIQIEEIAEVELCFAFVDVVDGSATLNDAGAIVDPDGVNSTLR